MVYTVQEEVSRALDMFEVAMMSIDAQESDSSWYLDSGATKHVTRDSSKMVDIRNVGLSNLRSVGGQIHSVKG